jgi:hypothetical protein
VQQQAAEQLGKLCKSRSQLYVLAVARDPPPPTHYFPLLIATLGFMLG